MHEMPVDPLEPPKFKHKKAPRGPPSPPVPVMHSPPRKVSQKDMQDWKIPPCVSNWKNSQGFTIPLDKRLAADGRGHSQVVISDKHAQVAESLLIAQEVSREGITARNKERERQQRLEKEKKDEQLRQLARDARMMRTGAAPVSVSAGGAAMEGRGGAGGDGSVGGGRGAGGGVVGAGGGGGVEGVMTVVTRRSGRSSQKTRSRRRRGKSARRAGSATRFERSGAANARRRSGWKSLSARVISGLRLHAVRLSYASAADTVHRSINADALVPSCGVCCDADIAITWLHTNRTDGCGVVSHVCKYACVWFADQTPVHTYGIPVADRD